MSMQENLSGKILNATSGWEPWLGKTHGEFVAIVQTRDPAYYPDYMVRIHTLGGRYLKARFAASALQRIAEDQNILSVELREHCG